MFGGLDRNKSPREIDERGKPRPLGVSKRIGKYYRLQAKLNICVKYTVHKTQFAENKNREIKNKLRAKLRMKKNFQC